MTKTVHKTLPRSGRGQGKGWVGGGSRVGVGQRWWFLGVVGGKGVVGQGDGDQGVVGLEVVG